MSKPRVAISACLLGKPVRYNGEHKKQDWLVEHLGKFVTWAPVCPELEMGLGVPRATMSLRGAISDPHLIVKGSGEDLTSKAQETSRRLVDQLGSIDGAILKRSSPSCGLEKVKVYGASGSPHAAGVGFFASVLKDRFRQIPMIEEGRILDLVERERYVVQLFTLYRFHHQLIRVEKKTSALQKFHEEHKLLLMSHSVVAYRQLGQLAATTNRQNRDENFARYEELLVAALKLKVSEKKMTNVFEHILGYFKDKISAREKSQLVKRISEFHAGQIEFKALLNLFEHLVDLHQIEYLKGQKFFQPYPRELLLYFRS